MPLAASMLEPNDDVDDEVSIAPRHRVSADRATHRVIHRAIHRVRQR